MYLHWLHWWASASPPWLPMKPKPYIIQFQNRFQWLQMDQIFHKCYLVFLISQISRIWDLWEHWRTGLVRTLAYWTLLQRIRMYFQSRIQIWKYGVQCRIKRGNHCDSLSEYHWRNIFCQLIDLVELCISERMVFRSLQS